MTRQHRNSWPEQEGKKSYLKYTEEPKIAGRNWNKNINPQSMLSVAITCSMSVPPKEFTTSPSDAINYWPNLQVYEPLVGGISHPHPGTFWGISKR